jgi:hypothetical protein
MYGKYGVANTRVGCVPSMPSKVEGNRGCAYGFFRRLSLGAYLDTDSEGWPFDTSYLDFFFHEEVRIIDI